MYILSIIAILIALYTIRVARNAHFRINNPPRSFHFTLSKSRDVDDLKGENISARAKIRFYVLYLSGKRVYFDDDTFDNISINRKIDTNTQIDSKKELVLHSWGDILRLQYITDPEKENAEQGEELLPDVLSLPKSSKNQEIIKDYLKQNGWKIETALSFDDIRITKDNLEVYITYIS
ncbi:MAG: hypothetical protein WDZ88_00790 [Candidatus Paceibacterota bacterium]